MLRKILYFFIILILAGSLFFATTSVHLLNRIEYLIYDVALFILQRKGF